MPAIKLGIGAYRRNYDGSPEIKLINRFVEQNPANAKEGSSLIARPGTNPLTAGVGQYRGSFSKLGLFDNDLFFVCGTNLYRYSLANKTTTQISGIINEAGTPSIAWMKGIGYEFLFIADGLLLQYYAGGTHATGTLSLSGGPISNQVIQIDGIYYSWNSSVDTGPPNGTLATPWLANPDGPNSGGDPLVAMANLINFNGTRGQDFSTALGGPNTTYSANATGDTATGTLTLSGGDITDQVINIGDFYYSWNINVEANTPDGSSTNPYLAMLGVSDAASLASMVKLLNYTGTPGSDYSAEVTAANAYATADSTATTLVLTALGPGPGYNSVATTITSGSYLAWGNATLTGGSSTAAFMIVTAFSDSDSGSDISTTVVSGLYLAWGSATLSGGGIQALEGVLVPAIAASDNSGSSNNAALSVCNLSSYVLVSISNSQAFYFILPGETTIDPLNFFEKESNPDNIIDMLTLGDQAVIIGQGSTENWYATGNFAAPFAPIEGRVYMRGTVAGTAVVVKDSVILVGDDGIVYEIGYNFGTTAQWGVHRISNHGIEERLRTQLRAEQGLT